MRCLEGHVLGMEHGQGGEQAGEVSVSGLPEVENLVAHESFESFFVIGIIQQGDWVGKVILGAQFLKFPRQKGGRSPLEIKKTFHSKPKNFAFFRDQDISQTEVSDDDVLLFKFLLCKSPNNIGEMEV